MTSSERRSSLLKVNCSDRTRSVSFGRKVRRTLSAVSALPSRFHSSVISGSARFRDAIDLGNKKATEETFDKDRFVHTGDECKIDEDGLLYVVDRIKE